MFKKYFKVLVLLVIVLIPSKVFALADSYFISMPGSYGSYYANYSWVAENSGGGYLTDSERASKTGLKCDENTKQYWYYISKAVISVNLSKTHDSHGNNYASCDTYTVTGSTKSDLETKVKSVYKTQKQSRSVKVECRTTSNVKAWVELSSSNTTVDYQLGNDVHYVGNSNFGQWAYSHPTYTKSNYTKTYCRWGDKTGASYDGVKELKQYKFVTSTGLTAYCINPGKAFTNQNHIKTAEFDTSNCKSSTDSYNCALAAAIVIGKANNYSDMVIQTVLRFIAAEYKDGDGIWDGANTYSSAGIFGNTSNAIRSSGYSGSTSASKGILYASGSNLTALQNAIKVYKQVKAGYTMWAPSVKITSSNYNAGIATLYVETNFDAKANIKSVTLSDGTAINYTKSACENNSSNTCIKITFSADESKIQNCNLKVRISYTHGGDEVISKIGMYLPSSNSTNYQKMLIYDTSSSDAVAEASLCGNNNLSCTVKNGVYYGKSGTPVSKETYDNECNEKPTTCPDPGIISDMPEDCSTDGTTGVIKDPNMCTILNSEENVKADYKKEYGNEYCTVYCNETLTFSFMDKAQAISGRYFVHDVSSYYSNKQNLSTVILSSRQCTSLINYDSWESAYRTADNEVRETWNTYKQKEAQVNHVDGPFTKTKSCSACASDSCCTTEHTTDKQRYIDITKRIDKMIDVPCTHCISGSGCAARTLSCQYYTWNNASYVSTDSKGDLIGPIDVSGNSEKSCTMSCSCSCSGCNDSTSSGSFPSYNGEPGAYTTAVNNRQALIDKINSCNFVEGSDAYNKVVSYTPKNTISIDYAENTVYKENYNIKIANEKTENHVVSRGYSDTTSWKEVCGSDCDGTLSNLNSTSNDGSLPYWECTGSEKTAKCVNVGITIPKNRLANIVVNTETIHYQNSEFYTQVFSGKVSTSTNNVGYWIKLTDNDKHLYPVSAYRLSGNYEIKVEYSNLGDQNKIRDMKGGTYTCSYDAINELTKYDCDDGYHECYPCSSTDEECDSSKVGLGVYFRTVSLSDLFPHSKYSPISQGTLTPLTRNIGQNWITTNAQKVVKEIQSNGDDVWATKKPMYTIKLTPTIMKNIRNYNSTRNYLDYSLSCSGLKCSSDFLQSNLKSLMDGKYSSFYSKDLSIKSNSLYYYSK